MKRKCSYGVSIGHYIMMFNWIARNSKENESEQVTTILSVACVIYGIQLSHQNCPSIEYKFSTPKFFLMLYVFVPPGTRVTFILPIGDEQSLKEV